MKRNLLTSVSLFITIITGLFFSGCSSFRNIELKQEYGFQNKNIITVYVVPSGDEELDNTYTRVMCLYLQANGYKVINANKILNFRKIPWVDHRQTADAILNDSLFSGSDIVVIIKARWDNISFGIDYQEVNYIHSRGFRSKAVAAHRITSEVAFYDHYLTEPIMSFSAIDTSIVMEMKESDHLYVEDPWRIVARELSKKLGSLPICLNNNVAPPTKTYKIAFWVDRSYREAFPDWMDRLRRRALYASDILCNQLGIQLVVTDFYEWDFRFGGSLRRTLENLSERPNPNSNTLRIGITLDEKLKTDWNDKNFLGFAYPLMTDAVMTAQPVFPGLSSWNSLEEALTLAHEIGHIFGGVHIQDKKSILYPHSGFLSYEFDDENKKIIEKTKLNLMNRNNELKLKAYAENLIEIKNSNPKNTVTVLEPIYSGFYNLFIKTHKVKKSDNITEILSTIIPDSVYSLAVVGLAEYYFEHLENARKLLTKVIQSDPEFAEAHYYLSKILKRLSEDNEAEEHYKIAKPYLKYWSIENDN